jgi:hypothetical protein
MPILTALFLLPQTCGATEDHLTRTFQAAYVGNEVRIIPVWFATWSSGPEVEVLMMCQPNMVNYANLATTKDLNLFSLYRLRAGVAVYDMPRLEFRFDVSEFGKPDGAQIEEERVIKAAIECVQRIAGDLGIDGLERIAISFVGLNARPTRWDEFSGEYPVIRATEEPEQR